MTEEKNIKVLVVDDDERLQAGMHDFLDPYGLQAVALLSGRDIVAKLGELAPDIVLLDVMLPEEDGFSVLRKIREHSLVPVIMLTARGDDVDRIVGLEMGADDYMAKPFNPRELLARIKAVLRRSHEKTKLEHDASKTNGMLQTGSLILDCHHQTLHRGENKKALSTAEFFVIQTFMQHADVVLSRDELLSLAFGNDYYVTDRSIDVHIARLRKLLCSLGDDEMRIRTVWGKGYSWSAED